MKDIGRFSVVASLILCSACGFLLVNGPPKDHEQRIYFDCTESNAGPILDLVPVGLLGIMELFTVGETSSSHAGPAIGGAFAGAYAASAIIGFGKTRHCRDAKLKLAERQLKATAGRLTRDSSSRRSRIPVP